MCEIPFRKCQKLSPDEFLAWAENLKGENQILWKEFQTHKYKSSTFPYFVFGRKKDITIKSRKFTRLQDYEYKCIDLRDDLRKHVDNLDPAESPNFLGELAGAWVLSEPAVGIIDWAISMNKDIGYEVGPFDVPTYEDGYISLMDYMFNYSEEFSKYSRIFNLEL